MKKYLIILLIVISVFSTHIVSAEVSNNSGFIPGQIWYSKDTLIEGDTVNIHTAIWNSEKESLSVKVEFYDKNVILGSREVTLASLELKDVYIPWKITSGDHIISAKIISSTKSISGKSEKIVLDNTTTSNDKRFVSVASKNDQGGSVLGASALKSQVDKTSSEVSEMIPDNVKSSFSVAIGEVEDFREKTFTKVTDVKYDTQKELGVIRKNESEKTVADTLNEKQNIEDATKKPITYIKLFLFSALYFIFGNKIVFYGVLIIFIFLIIRSIYRKIRNR